MGIQQSVRTDERTVAVLNASSRYALNFITFALLIDIVYRAVLRERRLLGTCLPCSA
jgi:hypothetical protein